MATLGEVGSTLAPFRWNKQRRDAVRLVGDDLLTNEAIAAELGVTRQAVDKWKRHPDFKAAVAEYQENARKAIERRGIRDKQNRINAYNERWKRLHRVMDARAVDPTMAHVPGADTGLIVRTFRGVGKGEDFQLVEEYTVDTGMLKEMREHEKQAAIEVGEWNEKESGKATAIDVLAALAAFGRGELDAPAPKQLPKATATTVEPEDDWGMPEA